MDDRKSFTDQNETDSERMERGGSQKRQIRLGLMHAASGLGCKGVWHGHLVIWSSCHFSLQEGDMGS